MALLGQFLTGMNLEAEILAGIEELDKKRETGPLDFAERPALFRAFRNDRL